MNKDMLKNVAIAFLVGILALSVLKYISALQEKYELLQELNKAKEEKVALENQKQNLLADLEKEKSALDSVSRQNSALKDYLRAGVHRIKRSFGREEADNRLINDISSKISLLKSEKDALVMRKDQLTQENEELKLKLNSLEELKKAIRDLKRRKVGATVLSGEGNRGYIIKDGQLNSPAKIKIEVIPASQAQGK